MALGTLSVCMTVLVLNLHHRDAERPVPKWARVLILGYLKRTLCVGARKPKTMAGNISLEGPDVGPGRGLRSGLRKIAADVGLLKPMLHANGDVDGRFSHMNDHSGYTPTPTEEKPDLTYEWKEIANVLDRLFFWLVFISMTASAMIILLVPVYKKAMDGTYATEDMS